MGNKSIISFGAEIPPAPVCFVNRIDLSQPLLSIPEEAVDLDSNLTTIASLLNALSFLYHISAQSFAEEPYRPYPAAVNAVSASKPAFKAFCHRMLPGLS